MPSKEIAKATQSFSSDRSQTLYRALPTLEYHLKRFQLMLEDDHFALVHHGIQAAIDKVRKYYSLMDCTSVYIVSLGENHSPF
jgi:hypothetical protein